MNPATSSIIRKMREKEKAKKEDFQQITTKKFTSKAWKELYMSWALNKSWIYEYCTRPGKTYESPPRLTLMLNHHMHSHISQLSRCLQCGENNGGRKKFFSRWLPQRNENNVSKTKCRMHTNSWKIKSYFVYGFNGCGGEKKKKKQNCWNSKKFFFHDLISSLCPESCSSLDDEISLLSCGSIPPPLRHACHGN